MHEDLVGLFESHGFGVLNAINEDAVTRRLSKTILDVVSANMFQHRYKVSIVHHHKSDHGIIYTSSNRKVPLTAKTHTKQKFNINDAVMKVEQFCRSNDVKCGDELNLAIEGIVRASTRQIVVKSVNRPIRPHVNRDLVIEIRKRDRLYHLIDAYPNNDNILIQYNESKDKVAKLNWELRSAYEQERFDAAAGDARKTWKLYREILQNQTLSKTEQTITIGGVAIDDSAST